MKSLPNQSKVQWKPSPCFNEFTRHELDMMVNVMLILLHPVYQLDGRLGGPQSGSGYGEIEKISDPTGNQTPVIQSVVCCYSLS